MPRQLLRLPDACRLLGLTDPALRQYVGQIGARYERIDPKGGDPRKVGLSQRSLLALAVIALGRRRHPAVALANWLFIASEIVAGRGRRLLPAEVVRRGDGARSWHWIYVDGAPDHKDQSISVAALIDEAAALADVDARVAFPSLAPEDATCATD